MKKAVLVLATLSVFSGQAMACSVVGHVPAADSDIIGLSWGFDGTVWTSHGSSASLHKDKIVQSDMNGNVLKVIRTPGGGTWGGGLTFDGQDLWCADYWDGKIYRINTTGRIEHTIKAPEGLSGIVRAKWNLWAASSISKKIYQINPANGAILKTLNAPGWQNSTFVISYGLAWDGVYLWVSTNDSFYKIDPGSGAILYSCLADQNNIITAITWDGEHILTGLYVMSIALARFNVD